ncbi:hypothetical protein C8R47DRAFT_1079628 [Mycena vitilis]|nr:hypothetical protein C8R47DRAFT_1079628 [Mycena vitilis]
MSLQPQSHHDSVDPRNLTDVGAGPQEQSRREPSSDDEADRMNRMTRSCALRRQYLQHKQLTARGRREIEKYRTTMARAPPCQFLQIPRYCNRLRGSSFTDPWVLRENGQLVLQSMSALSANPDEIRDLELLKRITLLGQVIHDGPPSTPRGRGRSHPVSASISAKAAQRPPRGAQHERRTSAPAAMTSAMVENQTPDVDKNRDRPWSGRKSHRSSLVKRYLGCRPALASAPSNASLFS